MPAHAEGSIYPEGRHLVAALDFGWRGGRRDRRRRYIDVRPFGFDLADEVIAALQRRGRGPAPARAAMRAAEMKLDDLRRERDRGMPAEAERVTVQQYLESWLTWVALQRSPKTHRTYADQVRLHIVPAIGSLRLRQLGSHHVRELLAGMLRDGLAPTTVQQTRRVLHRALEQARDDELIERNPAGHVDLGETDDEQERPILTPVQARALLAHVAGDRLAALYVVTLGLGLRKGEALGLAWTDIDLERSQVTISRQLQRDAGGVLVRARLKTGRKSRRVILMPEYVRLRVERHRELQQAERAAAADAGRPWPENDLIFVARNGSPLIARNVHRMWARHRAAAGLPEEIRWHDLRHTTSSFLDALGVSTRTRMEILGHMRASTTLEIYTHSLSEQHAVAAARLDALLAGGDAGDMFGSAGSDLGSVGDGEPRHDEGA